MANQTAKILVFILIKGFKYNQFPFCKITQNKTSILKSLFYFYPLAYSIIKANKTKIVERNRFLTNKKKFDKKY